MLNKVQQTDTEAVLADYFMLECYQPVEWDDQAMLKSVYFKEIETWRNDIDSWRMGRRLISELPNPIEIKIRHGYYPDDLKEMYNTDAIVITKLLLNALQEAGVDNLDVYPCVIVNEGTGFKTEDYVAVNLIGLVKATDLSKSNVVGGGEDHLLDTDFDGVAIDSKKAKDYLMFRLAENTSAIVIHCSVKEYLEAKGFDMLSFVEPKDWIG